MGGRRRAVPRQLLSRNSGAGYLDLETKLSDQLGIGASVRVEDSSEFARQIDWKVSLRYEITPKVALRATANTGFRAPTPGQKNTDRKSVVTGKSVSVSVAHGGRRHIKTKTIKPQ